MLKLTQYIEFIQRDPSLQQKLKKPIEAMSLATSSDVTNPLNDLYVKTDLTESARYIPLKYYGSEMMEDEKIYKYYLYENGFSNQPTRIIMTREKTMEEKISRELVLKVIIPHKLSEYLKTDSFFTGYPGINPELDALPNATKEDITNPNVKLYVKRASNIYFDSVNNRPGYFYLALKYTGTEIHPRDTIVYAFNYYQSGFKYLPKERFISRETTVNELLEKGLIVKDLRFNPEEFEAAASEPSAAYLTPSAAASGAAFLTPAAAASRAAFLTPAATASRASLTPSEAASGAAFLTPSEAASGAAFLTPSEAASGVAALPVVLQSYVFDFDCTLTTRHLYYFVNNLSNFIQVFPDVTSETRLTLAQINRLHGWINDYFSGRDSFFTNHSQNKEQFINLIFGNEKRITKLGNMFKAIGINNLYIASRGIKEQIIKVLDLVGLGGYVKQENITGGEVNKVHVLNRLISLGNVFYADDDSEEHGVFVSSHGLVFVDKENNFMRYNYNSYKYIFYNFAPRVNNPGGILEEMLEKIPTFVTEMRGGSDKYYDKYYDKYLKYKNKYLTLKNK